MCLSEDIQNFAVFPCGSVVTVVAVSYQKLPTGAPSSCLPGPGRALGNLQLLLPFEKGKDLYDLKRNQSIFLLPFESKYPKWHFITTVSHLGTQQQGSTSSSDVLELRPSAREVTLSGAGPCGGRWMTVAEKWRPEVGERV